MLETRAIVIQVDGTYALVQADPVSGCEQCNGKGCGSGKLSRLFCSKPRLFQVDNTIQAAVDDEVIVSVAEGAVLHGISMVYVLPMLLLLFGAILGSQLGATAQQSDIYAAIGAMAGLVVGFAFAKWKSRQRAKNQFQPYIARLWREV